MEALYVDVMILPFAPLAIAASIFGARSLRPGFLIKLTEKKKALHVSMFFLSLSMNLTSL